jgi:hypothetical protein
MVDGEYYRILTIFTIFLNHFMRYILGFTRIYALSYYTKLLITPILLSSYMEYIESIGFPPKILKIVFAQIMFFTDKKS